MADVESLLVPWLSTVLGVRVVTDTPANLALVLPVVAVLRVGGPADDNLPELDFPTVSIDCYQMDRLSSLTLAGQVHTAIRQTLVNTVHTVGSQSVVIVKTQTVTGPSWRPYDDTSLRRIGATYRIILRSR